MGNNKIRTRFAPSPTGFLHVGGLRTALYAYLFAKNQGGEMILRIEDTDQERLVKGASEHLQNILKKMGIEYNEGPDKGGNYGPYVQSKRLDIYKKYAKQLIDEKKAYYCFCSKNRLDELRENQKKRKLAPMYDKHCRVLPKEDIEKNLKNNVPYVIRQAIPIDQKIIFKDHIRGKVEFDSNLLDDHVLMKSDGFPTYHMAVVVDDHLMQISHIIRGEEWLPSTPKHIALYNAFNWDIPDFVHLPLLLNPDRTKLSKRQGDVNVEDYLAKGYLKDAIINFIALLGWHEKESDQEIYSLEELIKKFSLDRVQKAGAVFDIQKFEWINTYYIKQLNDAELLEKILPYLENEEFWIKNKDHKLLKRTLPDIRNRLKTLSDVPNIIRTYFQVTSHTIELYPHEKMKIDIEKAKIAIQEGIKTLKSINDNFTEENTKEALVNKIQKLEWKNGQLLWPMRVALTGEKFSPGVFELLSILQKEESLKRLNSALSLF